MACAGKQAFVEKGTLFDIKSFPWLLAGTSRQDFRSAVPRLFHAFSAISLVFQLADARQHESHETWVPSNLRDGHVRLDVHEN